MTCLISHYFSICRKEWGAEGALDYLANHRNQAASQLVEGLYREAVRFWCNQPQKDDIASVVIKSRSDRLQLTLREPWRNPEETVLKAPAGIGAASYELALISLEVPPAAGT
jgi:hypothetical protein